VKQKRIDQAFLFNTETANLYDGIDCDTKIIKITKHEKITAKIEFNKSSKNILFIDQPIKGQGIISDNEYENKILMLNNYVIAKGYNIFLKKHPRSTFRNQFNWKDFNEHTDCLAAVGFSSSLLINLSDKLPIFSLLDKYQLPKHLIKKVNFGLPGESENLNFENIDTEYNYICSCLTDQLQFMDVKKT
jgi:hypothetical protein